MNKCYLQILLLLLSCLSFSSYSEEIETLSIPLEDSEGESSLTISINNDKNDPASAFISLTNSDTKKKSEYIITNQRTLSLPSGDYSGILMGGSRRIPVKFDLTLTDNNEQSKNLIVKPFIKIEPTGWTMLDTFFNPPENLTGKELTAIAKSFEIRGIFTSDMSLFKNVNNTHKYYSIDSPLLAPACTYIHKNYGEIIALGNIADKKDNNKPEILISPLFSLLTKLNEDNCMTGISPIVFSKSENKIVSNYSEEFIFDTIAGPLYDFFLLDNFNDAVRVWHTLLNIGYRIPALYIGGNNFYQKNEYPTTKIYAKIPRKQYTEKYLATILKNGQTVLSNGPFIRFFAESVGSKDDNHQTGQDNTDWINGHSLKIGDLGFTSDRLRNIYAEAYSSSHPDDNIKTIELFYNGKVIEKKILPSNQKVINTTWKVKIDKPGWVQLRYISTNGKYHALTNPIYFADFNTRPPEPALAKTEIQVLDRKTGLPVEARIIVKNFGVTIDNVSIFKHPIIIKSPATASISVEAEGYKPMEKSIYINGGAARYIQSLNKKKLLPKALIAPVTYNYLSKALLNSKLVFKLIHN